MGTLAGLSGLVVASFGQQVASDIGTDSCFLQKGNNRLARKQQKMVVNFNKKYY
jgi:hypothetical protein